MASINRMSRIPNTLCPWKELSSHNLSWIYLQLLTHFPPQRMPVQTLLRKFKGVLTQPTALVAQVCVTPESCWNAGLDHSGRRTQAQRWRLWVRGRTHKPGQLRGERQSQMSGITDNITNTDFPQVCPTPSGPRKWLLPRMPWTVDEKQQFHLKRKAEPYLNAASSRGGISWDRHQGITREGSQSHSFRGITHAAGWAC